MFGVHPSSERVNLRAWRSKKGPGSPTVVRTVQCCYSRLLNDPSSCKCSHQVWLWTSPTKPRSSGNHLSKDLQKSGTLNPPSSVFTPHLRPRDPGISPLHPWLLQSPVFDPGPPGPVTGIPGPLLRCPEPAPWIPGPVSGSTISGGVWMVQNQFYTRNHIASRPTK